MKNIYKILLLGTLLIKGISVSAQTSNQDWSVRMAETAMKLWADSMGLKAGKPAGWTYEQGFVLKGIEEIWKRTGEAKYFDYIEKSMDFFVRDDGSIRTYKMEDYNIDNIASGRSLLMLYNVLSNNKKYLQSVKILKEQLNYQPRTKSGGFWHKKRYPNQMWLDGLYMGQPFYAEYAQRFNEPEVFNDIAKQFILMEANSRDAKTGLLYHAWDESKKEKWASKVTGKAPNVWGRAVGWYSMALVDVLDYFPQGHPKRDSIIHILKRLAVAVKKVQDPATGAWWQVLDKANVKGNYLEASVSSMLVYSLAKAVRNGYLDASYLTVAKKGYEGIIKNFISVDSGQVNLNKICMVAGLGGSPYRDGSFEYYINESVGTNDPKGIGAFILASVEMEIAAEKQVGKGKKVVLDYYFNNETKKDEATGLMTPYHYKWDEKQNGGFSLWGDLFKATGAKIDALKAAPSAANLKGTDVYIIVDPDTQKETPNPNYILPKYAKSIADWVKAGGVLVLMTNDSGNVEFTYTNGLAKRFGIEFNYDSRNRVKGKDFAMGKLPAPETFAKQAKWLYLKEVSTLTLTQPAQSILTDSGHVIMAVAKYGKGTVFAVGDPWLYNEYVDGRKLPVEYQNFTAAKELAQWLLQQVPLKVKAKK